MSPRVSQKTPRAAVVTDTTPPTSEREARSPDGDEPAGEEAADRRPALEREEVQRGRAAAEVLGRFELEHRERVRAPERVADARREQEHADRRERALRGEHELEDPEARRHPIRSRRRLAFPLVALMRAPTSAPAPKTAAMRPKVPAPSVQRLVGDEREQHVEVEGERREHEDDDERDAAPSRRTDEPQRLGRAADDRRGRGRVPAAASSTCRARAGRRGSRGSSPR